MKLLFTILVLLVLSACAGPSAAPGRADVPTTPFAPAETNSTQSNSPPTPQRDAAELSKLNALGADNEKFRVAPDAFKEIDFGNFTYPYQFPEGRKAAIALKAGEYEYDFADDRGWFQYSDAFYVDLTGDKSPEAIVMLSHVSCGGSCDGGAQLIHVYTIRQRRLKLLWQYETGSLGYGGGLKSFTVKNRKITLELFGGGFKGKAEGDGISEFQSQDVTRLTFGFDGRKFVEEREELISAPERSVKNYQLEVSISE